MLSSRHVVVQSNDPPSTKIKEPIVNQKEIRYLTSEDLPAIKTVTSKKPKNGLQAKFDVPMEERLKEVSASTSNDAVKHQTKGKRAEKSLSKSDELITLLVQGLHTSDAKTVDQAFSTSDTDLVTSAVRQLPVHSILPLLRELTQRMRTKTDLRPYIRWLHAVLSSHMAYLSTVPEIVDELSSQYQFLESRVAFMDSLLRLQGRIGLLMEQLTDKAPRRLELASQPAVAIYQEESESEEDLAASPAREDDAVEFGELDWSNDDEEAEKSDDDENSDEDQNEDSDDSNEEEEEDDEEEQKNERGRKRRRKIDENGIDGLLEVD